jgi:Cu-Zn family superoxide dismutase
MRLSKKLATLAVALVVSTFVWAVADDAKDGPKKAHMDGPKKAICVLTPTKDSKVSGVVTFTVKGDAIELAGVVTGLTPGKHGFHVHEFGDLNSADGMATGGHFNPDKEKHGGPHAKERHVGDLGNIEADENGKATLKMTDKLLALSGAHSIIGRGLIVHAKADDFTTQPTGDAGGRVAQGVIGVAKAP